MKRCPVIILEGPLLPNPCALVPPVSLQLVSVVLTTGVSSDPEPSRDTDLNYFWTINLVPSRPVSSFVRTIHVLLEY